MLPQARHEAQLYKSGHPFVKPKSENGWEKSEAVGCIATIAHICSPVERITSQTSGAFSMTVGIFGYRVLDAHVATDSEGDCLVI